MTTRAVIGFKVPRDRLYRDGYTPRCGCNIPVAPVCPNCGLTAEPSGRTVPIFGFNGRESYASFDAIPISGGYVIGRATADSLPLLVEEFLFVYTRVREKLESDRIYDGSVFGLWLAEDSKK